MLQAQSGPTVPLRRWHPADIEAQEETPAHRPSAQREAVDHTERCWARVQDPARPCHVRGVLVRRAHAFLASMSEARVRGVVSRLSREDAAVLHSPLGVRAAGWYPLPFMWRLLEATCDELAPFIEAPAFELGRFHSRQDTCALFQPLFKYGRMEWLAGASATVWRLFHSRGRVDCTWHDGPMVVSRVVGHPAAHVLHCEATRGFITGALQAATGERFTVQHTRCQALGAEHCTFVTRLEH